MIDTDARLLAGVKEQLGGRNSGEPVGVAQVAEALRRTGLVHGSAAIVDTAQRLTAEISGAGPLQPLLDDPEVTDVFVNGPHDVFVDDGRGIRQVEVPLGDSAHVRALAVRLAALGGRRLDDASPLVDARLPSGVRVNAVLPPISGECATLSLRIPRGRSFTLDDFVDLGTLPPDWADALRAIVAQGRNVLVTGGTGAGKTALLGAMLSSAPPTERLVIVEDAAELAPTHPHVVRLLARRRNIESAGEITLADLVINALRMRPDRLVVGECRGAEVRELLAALNTGHSGGGTMHANTVTDVPARLEALGALAGMSQAAVAAQSVSALDVLVHIERSAGDRKVVQLAVPYRTSAGLLAVEPVMQREADDSTTVFATGRRMLTALGVPVPAGVGRHSAVRAREQST
ncbi:TadA family conjugal transfer-associated ATPase [Spelaeicoccus albus]|uniref:Pilus assembly protein CpaF n=1 Tax=Spelaeicoccus albus TaxID=1280376 RepID=A0A7Z0A792_9MICO|nr:TadA family conjugal transfer-associated ATPase [Spelaeicoccus albus]NYI65722.1 pilus assembly protein CpaF [Spelaeicoccus albus]